MMSMSGILLCLFFALRIVSGSGICHESHDCEIILTLTGNQSCCNNGISSIEALPARSCAVREWSPCSMTCGSAGYQIRGRYIINSFTHSDCDGLTLTEVQPCDNGPCPLDCDWVITDYGSVTCTSITQQPMYGGIPCPPTIIEGCRDDNLEQCIWYYGTPTECSATCGGGTRLIPRIPLPGQLCPTYPEPLNEICYDIPCPGAQIRLERKMYEVFESSKSLEICAVAESLSDPNCPVNYTLGININISNNTGDDDYALSKSVLVFKPCETRVCFDVLITDDILAEREESFVLYLKGNSDLPDDVEVSSRKYVVTITDTDAMIVGFDSPVFTAIESEREVKVCVSIFNSPSGALDSFAVAFIPEEGYRVSNNQYVLECNRNDSFSTGTHQVCINYTVYDDNVCELQHHSDSYFEIRLLILSTTDRGPFLDSNHSVAGVTIDDSQDEECYVRVGYVKDRYVLNNTIGYTELCIRAISPGISVEFSISLEINTTDNVELSQSTATLMFGISESKLNETKCYNISGDTISCDSFSDCQNLSALAYFEWYNGSNKITLNTSKVEIEIELPENCLMNFITFPIIYTSNQPPPTNIVTGQTNDDRVLIAVASSLSGLVLTIIAIFTTLLILFILARKRRKEKGITDAEVRYVASKESKLALSDELKQLLNDKKMIIPKDFVKLSSTIGQGESGLVYRAYLTTLNGKELVAVKTVKALFSNTDVARLAKEISTMLSFNHPNVMSLIGVCIDAEVSLLIMPYMSNGSLLSYVKLHKDRLLHKTEKSEGQKPGQVLLGMCYQVAKGMEYLSQQRFVHRDLAARNCMLGKSGLIKVADFGLTEDMYGTNYFRRSRNVTGSEEKVPIRWMAPESIENDVYTESTDVWSYGVTVWEVFTCGRIPYTGIPVMSLLKSLQRGERLERPENEACTDEIYEMMRECWNAEDQKRPKFQELVEKIDNLLEIESGYLSLSPAGNDYAVPFISTHSETTESCL